MASFNLTSLMFAVAFVMAAAALAALGWQLRMACLTARWNAGRRLR